MSNGETGAGDGHTITINGATYPKGLGTHANADIRYTVPSGCTTFTAQVGIDDESGSGGSVIFEVWDGTTTRLYQSPVKTGSDGASAVSVSVVGVSTLRLVVDMNGSANSDHADWGDAKFNCGGGSAVSYLYDAAGNRTRITYRTRSR